MNCTIGIIGCGRFGRLAARYLGLDFRVVAYDPVVPSDDIRACGAEPVPFAAAAGADVVVPAVPISRLRSVLSETAPHLRPGSLLVDVCSVKELPVEWMRQILPESVELLGTHPMFGPDSAGESLEGRKIVVCPIRLSPARLARVTGYLASKGLQVIETSAADHDRQIATSLALTHFIGRTLAAMDATPLPIDTEGYKRLLRILEVVEHDTWQLFEDMHRFNRYAADARRRFLREAGRIDGNLE